MQSHFHSMNDAKTSKKMMGGICSSKVDVADGGRNLLARTSLLLVKLFQIAFVYLAPSNTQGTVHHFYTRVLS